MKIEYNENKAHYIVATCIVMKYENSQNSQSLDLGGKSSREGKFLIVKRADWEKNSPGKWTVPGGKLEKKDYLSRKQDTADGKQWYNVAEELVRREVREETCLEIKNIGYVTSLVFFRSDGIPTLVISLYADYDSEDLKLCDALTEYKWVSLEEAKNYDLIDGIYEELEILEKHLKSGEKMCWGKKA